MNDRFDLLIFEDAQEMKERREKEYRDRRKNLTKIEEKGCCEGSTHKCDNIKDVKWISAMTYYIWDIDEEPLKNPNRPIFLCSECAEEYNNNWQAIWNDYYAGLL